VLYFPFSFDAELIAWLIDVCSCFSVRHQTSSNHLFLSDSHAIYVPMPKYLDCAAMYLQS